MQSRSLCVQGDPLNQGHDDLQKEKSENENPHLRIDLGQRQATRAVYSVVQSVDSSCQAMCSLIVHPSF